MDEEGLYIKSITLPDGTNDAAEPCNPEAAKSGGKYAVLLMLSCLGYVIADVAADGLTPARVGYGIPHAHMGGVGSTIFVGPCMNGYEYNGSFSWTLSFEAIALVMTVPAASCRHVPPCLGPCSVW